MREKIQTIHKVQVNNQGPGTKQRKNIHFHKLEKNKVLYDEFENESLESVSEAVNEKPAESQVAKQMNGGRRPMPMFKNQTLRKIQNVQEQLNQMACQEEHPTKVRNLSPQCFQSRLHSHRPSTKIFNEKASTVKIQESNLKYRDESEEDVRTFSEKSNGSNRLFTSQVNQVSPSDEDYKFYARTPLVHELPTPKPMPKPFNPPR